MTKQPQLIAAHCGTNGLFLDYEDGSFDTIPIRMNPTPALRPLRLDSNLPVAGMIVNPNAGIKQAYPGGRW